MAESQANGAVEGAIQRTQGQNRAAKHDIESATGIRAGPAQPILQSLVEHVGQVLLFWCVNPLGGAMSTQRLRGKSRVAATPRLVEKALYKVDKLARIDKTAPRWQAGVQTSDDNVIGPPLGVTKCARRTRADASAIVSVKGSLWVPPTRHPCFKVRSHIGEQLDIEDNDDEGPGELDS